MLPAPLRNFYKVLSVILVILFFLQTNFTTAYAAKNSKLKSSRKSKVKSTFPLSTPTGASSQFLRIEDVPKDFPSPKELQCSGMLTRLAKSLKPSNIRRLFSDWFYDFKGEDDFEWLGRVLKDDLMRTLHMRLKWYEYNIHPERFRDHKVYWIQIAHLKELNKSWDVKTSEFALTMLNEELAKLLSELKSDDWLIHQNYKDRVIVSKFSTEKFNSFILIPLKTRFANRIREIRSEAAEGLSWEEWAEHVLHFGSSPDLIYAHVDLKLRSLGYENADYESVMNWRRRLEWSYRRLFSHDILQLVSREDILKATRIDLSSEEGQAELVYWMGKMNIPLSRKDEITVWITDFRRGSSVGDFLPLDMLPSNSEIEEINELIKQIQNNQWLSFADITRISNILPKAWTVQRALFYFKAMKSGTLLFVDLKNFGLKAAEARADWIANGARLNELPSIYNDTTHDLFQEFSKITAGVDIILNKAQDGYYASGDDAIWALPALSDEQEALLESFLKRNPRIHFHIQKIEKIGDAESLSQAINDGDAALSAKKEAAKKAASK